MASKLGDTTQSDTTDDKDLAQLQARLRQQTEQPQPSRYHIPIFTGLRNSKGDRKEGTQPGERYSLRACHLYAIILVLLLKLAFLMIYLTYQSKSITILVHELQRIGDGTDFILGRMNFS